jgi:tetratricopeptide (TPR) repeat protein
MLAERYWQSDDLCVIKIVIAEGDFTKDNSRFGADVTLTIEDHDLAEFLEKHEDSIYVTKHTIDSNELKMRLGLGSNDLDLGLEKAVLSMYPGEKSRFDVSSNVGDADEWQTLHFVATLEPNTDSNEPVYQWTAERKLKTAQDSYERAVVLVKVKKYNEAFKMFHQSAALSTFVLNSSSEKSSQVSTAAAQDLKVKCFSNITLCHHNLKEYENVIKASSFILEKMDKIPNKIKLLYRRGHAHLMLKSYSEAIKDFNQVLVDDPKNAPSLSDLTEAKKHQKSHEEQLSNAMKKMFS